MAFTGHGHVAHLQWERSDLSVPGASQPLAAPDWLMVKTRCPGLSANQQQQNVSPPARPFHSADLRSSFSSVHFKKTRVAQEFQVLFATLLPEQHVSLSIVIRP